MATFRITEAEAARDFAAVLARVREGAEVIIEGGGSSPAIALHIVENPHVRRLSESLRIARERGSTTTLDDDFARDLEDVINCHPEPLDVPWE